jgi:hypothetical protein
MAISKRFKVLLINPQYPHQLYTTSKEVHLKWPLNKGLLKRIRRDFAAKPGPQMPILIWGEKNELENVRKKALRDFYLRPGYFLERAVKLRSNTFLPAIKARTQIFYNFLK